MMKNYYCYLRHLKNKEKEQRKFLAAVKRNFFQCYCYYCFHYYYFPISALSILLGFRSGWVLNHLLWAALIVRQIFCFFYFPSLREAYAHEMWIFIWIVLIIVQIILLGINIRYSQRRWPRLSQRLKVIPKI